MSLLGGIANFGKKLFKGAAKIIDSPVGRAIGSVSPGAGALVGLTQGLTMKQPRVRSGQFGGMQGFMPTMSGSSFASSLFDPFLEAEAGGMVDVLTPDFLVKPVSKKRRRMNPLNARAARRAIRRIKAVRRITNDIERSLPKARAARPRSYGGQHKH